MCFIRVSREGTTWWDDDIRMEKKEKKMGMYLYNSAGANGKVMNKNFCKTRKEKTSKEMKSSWNSAENNSRIDVQEYLASYKFPEPLVLLPWLPKALLFVLICYSRISQWQEGSQTHHRLAIYLDKKNYNCTSFVVGTKELTFTIEIELVVPNFQVKTLAIFIHHLF